MLSCVTGPGEHCSIGGGGRDMGVWVTRVSCSHMQMDRGGVLVVLLGV